MRAGRFAYAWIVSALIIFTFDLLWCALTTFRSMSFIQTYVYALLGAALLAFPSALAPRRPWIQLLLWLAASGVMTANMMYYRTYFTAIPAASYAMAGNLADFRGSVTDSLALTDILLPLESLAGYILLRRRKPGKPYPLVWALSSFILGMAAWLCALPYGGARSHIRWLSQQCYYANCPPVIYTLAWPVMARCSWCTRSFPWPYQHHESWTQRWSRSRMRWSGWRQCSRGGTQRRRWRSAGREPSEWRCQAR